MATTGCKAKDLVQDWVVKRARVCVFTLPSLLLVANEIAEEDTFDAMGNKVESAKKKKKLTSSELRKKKKDRMARRKRGEEVFSDEDDF